MIRQFAFIASTLALSASLALPALAADTTGQPGRGGDGHCPIPTLTTDPDCVREDGQPYQEQAKSSRDEFPACRNGRAGQPMPPGCRKAVKVAAEKCDKAECRNQFPGDRSAPPAPRAPRQ